MPIDKIAIPPEPISTATRRELEAKMDAARKRWEHAAAAYHAAEQNMQDECQIYHMIDDLLRSGPGHVFTSPVPGRRRGFLSTCRHCRAFVGSTTVSWPCPGDTHTCPTSVYAAESGAVIKLYERDDLLCGQPGAMSSDFTTWTCLLGHVIDGSHADSVVRHDLAHCIAACPWPDLISASLVT